MTSLSNGQPNGVQCAPRVSLGLPVYNGAKFLDECISSIVSQSYPDFELNICDNASTDETPKIAEKWVAIDRRINYHRADTNRGAAANFNWSFSLARAEFFKWCAADDLMAPAFLEKCLAALDVDRNAVLAYPDTMEVDEQGRPVKEADDNSFGYEFDSPDVVRRYRDIVCHNHQCYPVFGVIRREVLGSTSLIGAYVSSDNVLLAELALVGHFRRVPELLFLHRQHEGRSVTAYRERQGRLSWFDPSAPQLSFPNFRLAKEYARTVLDAELSRGERRRCLVHVLRWIRWHGWKGFSSDLRYAFLR